MNSRKSLIFACSRGLTEELPAKQAFYRSSHDELFKQSPPAHLEPYTDAEEKQRRFSECIRPLTFISEVKKESSFVDAAAILAEVTAAMRRHKKQGEGWRQPAGKTSLEAYVIFLKKTSMICGQHQQTAELRRNLFSSSQDHDVRQAGEPQSLRINGEQMVEDSGLEVEVETSVISSEQDKKCYLCEHSLKVKKKNSKNNQTNKTLGNRSKSIERIQMWVHCQL